MIGLGIMGSAMSKNLIKAGFSVIGFDVLPKAMEAFAAGGGKPAKSVGEVGSGGRHPDHVAAFGGGLVQGGRGVAGVAARATRCRGNQHIYA